MPQLRVGMQFHPQATTVERVNQRVVFVEQQRKRALLDREGDS